MKLALALALFWASTTAVVWCKSRECEGKGSIKQTCHSYESSLISSHFATPFLRLRLCLASFFFLLLAHQGVSLFPFGSPIASPLVLWLSAAMLPSLITGSTGSWCQKEKRPLCRLLAVEEEEAAKGPTERWPVGNNRIEQVAKANRVAKKEETEQTEEEAS